MLKINIFVRLRSDGVSPDDFNIENLSQQIKENGLAHYIREGSYPLSINVNGINLLGDVACYPFNENLKALNNLFYNVIKLPDNADNKINFMAGLGAPENYLYAVKKNNKLLLFGRKGVGFVVDFSEWLDLEQAVEEMLRVIKDYKDTCMQVAEKILPDDTENFLKMIFKEPTWNHDPWFPLEEVWTECKQKNAE